MMNNSVPEQSFYIENNEAYEGMAYDRHEDENLENNSDSSDQQRSDARGKILNDHKTKRQVGFSKRKKSLFEKAKEHSNLYDDKVSIFLISSTGKVYDHVSENTTHKEMIDNYQQVHDVDLWKSHYEKMQQEVHKQMEVYADGMMELGLRKGDKFDNMSYHQSEILKREYESALKRLHERKLQVLQNQVLKRQRKVNSAKQLVRYTEQKVVYAEAEQQLYRSFLGSDARLEDPNYLGFSNGGPSTFGVHQPYGYNNF